MQAIAGSKIFSPLDGRNRVQGWRTFCNGSSARALNLAVTEGPAAKISKGAVGLKSSVWGSRKICMEKRMNLGLTNKRGGSSKFRAKAYGMTEGILQICEESGTDIAQAVRKSKLRKRRDSSQFVMASNVDQATSVDGKQSAGFSMAMSRTNFSRKVLSTFGCKERDWPASFF